MAKARYIARVCYDDDFKAELEKFSRLIKLDAHIAELSKKNKNQRFSAAIRFLIEEYNKTRTNQ
jgi:hypothetical protein